MDLGFNQQSMAKIDILRMNVNQLTEEQKQSMIVEERYTFFQIENKLRQICQEGMEALRTRITKEAEMMRKVQQIAEAARRDVATMEPRIERALQTGPMLNKLGSEINALEQQIRIATEKETNDMEMMMFSNSSLEAKVS